MGCMKIDKCCLNCEFKYGDVCASHNTLNGYGWNIDNYKIQRQCWKVSLAYAIKLADQLEQKEKNMYYDNTIYEMDDLVRRIETGTW